MSDNPYRAPQAPRGGLQLGDEPLSFAQTPQQRNAGPAGLGGWLILVAIGLVMTVLKNFFVLRSVHLPLFADDAWAMLTTPGSEHYHPLLGPLVLFEAIGNGAFLAFALVLLGLFFRKSRRFPRWMIVLHAANLVFVIGDLLVGMQIPSVAQQGPADGVRQVIQACVAAAIWIPYLLSSRRVRNTFVEPRLHAVRREPMLEPAHEPR